MPEVAPEKNTATLGLLRNGRLKSSIPNGRGTCWWSVDNKVAF